MTSLARILGPRSAHSVDPAARLSMPGPCALPDTEHSSRIDWRDIELAIGLVEWRWYHFTIAPKPSGRNVSDILRSPVFKAQSAVLLNRIMDAAFPERSHDILTFPDLAMSGSYAIDGRPALSFHVNAKSQTFGRALSHHQRTALAQSWSRVAEAQRVLASGGTA